jgi:serine phosphatase RsbU (regulator of sigma subunit)/DNA-binding response OmpR family regulator/anti-sigma regulatory factor (Ser/Thr protein kinase)
VADPLSELDIYARALADADAPASAGGADELEKVEPPLAPAKILIVDDRIENLVALEAVLAPLGQPIVRATSGRAALQRLLREEFAVVLLDVRMPGLDGLETARYVKARERTRHTPIIFLTAFSHEIEEVFRGYAAGAVDYVTKPFEPEVLRSKVGVFVELHRERAQREREAAARGRAEAVAVAVRKVQSVSDVALAHLELDELLSELVDRLRQLFGADSAGVALGDSPESLRVRATSGLERRPQATMTEPDNLISEVARSGRAQSAALDSDSVLAHESLRGLGVRAMLAVPLLTHERPLGVLYVASRGEDRFSDEDSALLELCAERASTAIAHARRYEAERDLVELLQRSLLPQKLPRVERLELAARYRPGGRASSVGGDWYDALPLSDGRAALAIGDVVGRGVRAAAVMSELRHALRALAIEGRSPGRALEQLNSLMVVTHGHAMVATLLHVVIDPWRGKATFASAGHLPPLLIEANGAARYYDCESVEPLGVIAPGPIPEHEIDVPAGSTLVLCTDGLIERRGETIDAGLKRLRQAVRDCPSDLEALCDQLLARLIGESELDDDVAVLAARTAAVASGPLNLSFPAEPEVLRDVRRALADWLAEQGAPGELIEDARLACSEAAANAIEHAYGTSDHEFQLHAERHGSRVTVTVRDHGRWRSQRPGGGAGSGLVLIEALSDDVVIDRGSDGTLVELSFDLPTSKKAGRGRGRA